MATANGSGTLRRLFSGANGFMVAALASATIILVASAVVGARDLSRDGETAEALTDGRPGSTTGTDFDFDTSDGGTEITDGSAGPGGGAGAAGGGTGGGAVGGGGDGGPGGGGPAGPPPDTGSREGVHRDHIEWGVHAPVTLNGAPLNIAEDPIIGLKGYLTALNRGGGIHARKFRMFLEDDAYTTTGGRQASDRLVKEVKPFFISGTLGVDQINIVATNAGRAGIPYMAIGGPEPEWKDKGMYQVGSSYDQYMELLAQFICRFGKSLVGENEVRIGTTTLDTPFILPVEKRFVDKLSARNCVAPIDGDARGKVQKPDRQTTYTDQIIRLQNSYEGKGANLIVPLQDPVTTSRQVAELTGFATYDPQWTFNNFAHDSDTTLLLMRGEWTGTRGLSAGCYHLSQHALDPAHCAQMRTAHDIWVNLGHVEYDQNAGGDAGGHDEYDYNQASWEEDGQGGSGGYQLVHFWTGAMNQIGPDPTREKFVAALQSYAGYNNLLTAPISFAGSDNPMRGALGGTVWEGTSSNSYRQVTEITPGIVDHF